MTERRKFILSEVIIYMLVHIINIIYIVTVIDITSKYKIFWDIQDYIISWTFLILYTVIYIVLFLKQFRYQKKIGLGSIYSVITEILYIAMNISTILFDHDGWKWNEFNIMLVLFSFTALPILFIIIAIIYFKRKKAKEKSGE